MKPQNPKSIQYNNNKLKKFKKFEQAKKQQNHNVSSYFFALMSSWQSLLILFLLINHAGDHSTYSKILAVVKDHKLKACNKPPDAQCTEELDGWRNKGIKFNKQADKYIQEPLKKIMDNCDTHEDFGRNYFWMSKYIRATSLKKISSLSNLGNCGENAELVFSDIYSSDDLSIKNLIVAQLSFEEKDHAAAIIFPEQLSDDNFLWEATEFDGPNVEPKGKTWNQNGITALAKSHPDALLVDHYSHVVMPLKDVMDPAAFKKHMLKINKDLAEAKVEKKRQFYLEGRVKLSPYIRPSQKCAQQELGEFEGKVSNIKLS